MTRDWIDKVAFMIGRHVWTDAEREDLMHGLSEVALLVPSATIITGHQTEIEALRWQTATAQAETRLYATALAGTRAQLDRIKCHRDQLDSDLMRIRAELAAQQRNQREATDCDARG